MTKQIAVFASLLVAISGWSGWTAWAAHERVKHPGVDGWAVDLKALGAFPLDPEHGTTADVPPRFRDLDGKHVVVESYQAGFDNSAGHPPRFQLVYNLARSGRLPAQERIVVTLSAGHVTPSSDEVRVSGTLHVGVVRDAGGQIESVYRLDVDSVKPVE